MSTSLNLRVRRTAKRALGWDREGGQSRVQRVVSDLLIHNFLDMALRYRPIVRYLDARLAANDPVLDVGSGPVGITPYFRRPVVGVDRSFAGPGSSRLRRCRADIGRLPFAAAAFPAVICVDVLEHLPEPVRQAAIQEMVRVAGRFLVLAFPSGEAAAAGDRELDRYLRRHLGRGDAFLTEHLENGLPDAAVIVQLVTTAADSQGRRCSVRTESNVNLRTWLTVNRGKAHLWLRAAYVLAFSVLLPILGRRNAEPAYRKILFVELG